MSIRTTVALRKHVYERLKRESRRLSCWNRFVVKPKDVGLRAGLSYDNVEELIEYAEGPDHR